MSKRQVITVLGVWVMGFLFLGIPSSWHKAIGVLTGLIIVSIALSLRPEQSRPTASTPTVPTPSSNQN